MTSVEGVKVFLKEFRIPLKGVRLSLEMTALIPEQTISDSCAVRVCTSITDSDILFATIVTSRVHAICNDHQGLLYVQE